VRRAGQPPRAITVMKSDTLNKMMQAMITSTTNLAVERR
jgi:hypothetical protein